MFIIPPLREPDDFGSGYFGAPRGSRKHNGIDLAAAPGAIVCSCTAGRITRIGYPYGDDLSYRYVEVTDEAGYQARYFYVEPKEGCGTFEIGSPVAIGDRLGVVQDIAARYAKDGKKMNNHFHFEVKLNGEFVSPEVYLTTQKVIP